MVNRTNEIKTYLPWCLVAVLLLTNFFTFYSLNKKIVLMESNNILNAVEAVIESSNNAISIYEYSRYQYEEGVIDENAISKTLGSLVTLHDKLENILKQDTKNKTMQELLSLTQEMIKNRREGFSNLKSGVDLNSESYNKVADKKFSEAETIKEQILSGLEKIRK